MTSSLEMVVQSHLSDSLIEMSHNPELAHTRITFVKYLINKYDGDLTKRVNIENDWEAFNC